MHLKRFFFSTFPSSRKRYSTNMQQSSAVDVSSILRTHIRRYICIGLFTKFSMFRGNGTFTSQTTEEALNMSASITSPYRNHLWYSYARAKVLLEYHLSVMAILKIIRNIQSLWQKTRFSSSISKTFGC